MNLRFLDRIWHVTGCIELAPDQGSDDVFDRLEPLFVQPGTSHDRVGDTLTFRKKDAAAQDKMSVFDHGELRIERGAPGPATLRYDLVSRMLLLCFLAPLMFLAIAGATVALVHHQSILAKAAGKVAAAKDAADKDKVIPLNPIDKALGAPEPEKPKKGADETRGRNKKPSPTPACVFAAIFAILYVVGRTLEDRLIRRVFRTALASATSESTMPRESRSGADPKLHPLRTTPTQA